MNSNRSTYDTMSQILHWLMVFLFVAMFAIGWGREFIPGPMRDVALNAHKTMGVLLLTLVLVRLIWALARPAVDTHTDIFLEYWAAKGAHIVLYVLMFILPLSGMMAVFYFGKSISFFGLYDLYFPALKDRSAGIWLKEIHEAIALGMAGLIGVHILAALYHHFIRKDDVLKRMMS